MHTAATIPLPDKQQSEAPTLAHTLAELNQTMGHMSMMLGDLWQKSQDDTPLQQTAVEDRHADNIKHGRKRTCVSASESQGSEDSSASEDDDHASRQKQSAPFADNTSEISVHVQEDDSESLLLQNSATTKANPSTDPATDETLKQLGEMLEDTEATCDEVIPRLATIIENRWNKKLAPEKLTLIHEKYQRPANCPAVVSVKVNPEIWAKLPTYQQRVDTNVSKIQESVRKAALISLKTAQALSSSKPAELDVKQLLTQQVDLLALLGHINHELSSLQRYKIKSVLKPEYSSICTIEDGTQSKFLFGDDLPKRLKDAKEASNVGLVMNTSHSKRSNYESRNTYNKSHDNRYKRKPQGGPTYYDSPRGEGFRRGKSNHSKKKRQQYPRK